MELVAEREELRRATGLGLLARSRQGHIDRGDDAPRRAAEHEHAVGEVDGLVDVVRDVDDRDASLLVLMEAQHEVLELGARERVHRCERLVEQEDLRTRDERSRDRHALLHATGELPRVFLPHALQPHFAQDARRRARASPSADPAPGGAGT